MVRRAAESRHCDDDHKDSSNSLGQEPLTLEKLLGTFVIVGLGLMVAFVIFILEGISMPCNTWLRNRSASVENVES